MIETAKMSERGQIVIPKDIRDHIHAEEGTVFTLYVLDSGTIIMRKLDTAAIVEEFRKIRAKVKEHLTNDEINAEIHAAREDMRRDRHQRAHSSRTQ